MPNLSTYFTELSENYERLTDLNDEGCSMLLETLHETINDEMNDLVTVLNDTRKKVLRTERYADGSYIDILKKYKSFCAGGIKSFKMRHPHTPVTERTMSRITNNAAKSIENHYNLKKNEVKYIIALHNVENMKRFLSSKYYDAISLGHGKDILSTFESMLKGNAPVKRRPKDITPVKVPFKKDAKEVREHIKKWREFNRLDYYMASEKIGISATLLKMVEDGDVTHPKIAEKIQKACGLSDEETKYLMPENRRKGTPEYDPDKFKPIDDIYRKTNMIVVPTVMLDWDGYRR